jgi:nucleoside-diphosphate kinase
MKQKLSTLFIFALCLFQSACALGPKPGTTEQTLAIIKPTAVLEGHIGAIIDKIEKANLRLSALKMTKLSKLDAESFYAEHKDKPFFSELVAMMTSGPIVAMVVEGQDAIGRLRTLVGATDPKKAESNTIRGMYGKNITENACHASDSAESAIREIPFFFNSRELFPEG